MKMAQTILIVDDSATARMIIKRCLTIAGFQEAEFIEAGNGKEALQAARENTIDLLISDLNMPEMDGKQLLRHVKASPRLNYLPVMLVTSSNNPAIERELKELGAFAVMNKPVAPANLAEALKDNFEQSSWGE